jgi:hypothetical protein
MRLKTMAIFGVGYLYGIKAGTQRYEELSAKARTLLELDGVRMIVDRAATSVEDAVGKVPGFGTELRAVASKALGGTGQQVSQAAKTVKSGASGNGNKSNQRSANDSSDEQKNKGNGTAAKKKATSKSN